MSRRFLLLLCCIFGGTPPVAVATNDPYFANISVRDGLFHVYVYCILKDSRGFMWFGTGDGLNRYDGYEFVGYRHNRNDSLTLGGNRILCLAEDRSGYLWVGTGSGLNRFDPATGTFRRYTQNGGASGRISNNYVRSLYVDSSNRIWAGVDGSVDLYDPETDNFTGYKFDGIFSDSRVDDIIEDGQGYIWATTTNNGVVRFDPKTFRYQSFRHDPKDPYSLSSNTTSTLFLDSEHRVWIGSGRKGLSYYDRENNRFITLPVPAENPAVDQRVRCIGEDTDKNIWVGTTDGVFIADLAGGTTKRLKKNDKTPGSLSHNTVISIFRDEVGSIWLGTYGGGVDFYNPALGQFRLHEPQKEVNRYFGHIGPMLEHNGRIWIGTEGDGLECYDPKTRTYERFDIAGSGKKLRNDAIRSMYIDRDGLMWIGSGGMEVLTFDTRRRVFTKRYGHSHGLVNTNVNDIFQDSKGRMWVGTNHAEGLFVKHADVEKFTCVHSSGIGGDTINYPWIRVVHELRNGELWVGSMQYGIFVLRDGKYVRRICTANTEITSDYISLIFEDSRGRIWIGTHGGGLNLFDPETGSFRYFTTENGLPNDNVCSITEDSSSNFWIATMGGLICYNDAENTITSYTHNHGNFPIEILSLKSGLQTYTPDGYIYIGGNNAFVSFSPKEIRNNQDSPRVAITDLLLHNRPVRPFDATGILDRDIRQTDEIVLKNNQTDIVLKFVALNYIYPQNNHYSYMLEGYDKEWTDPGYQRSATYTNIPSGSYTFRVRASNDSGVWNNEGVSLIIRVMPSPGNTWWAICIYVAFFGSIVYLILRYYMSRLQFQNAINLKQLEKQTLEKNHQMRINLFTNFSHELRTPLTLILDPMKNTLEDNDLPEKFREQLHLMYKNAKKMLVLVNQLMDFRKHESGQLPVKVKRSDMVKFSREIVIIFKELAQPRNIRLQLRSKEKEIQMYFDPFLMEKVYFNLLSNALKSTPENGTIDIEIQLDDKRPAHADEELAQASTYLCIVVADTGKGIPEDDLERIFDPFFQIGDQDGSATHGTGIGLHLTRSIIKLHHGIIWAESEDRRGARFHIVLPVNKSIFGQEEFLNEEKEYPHLSGHLVVAESIARHISPEDNRQRNHPVVLIVDDNADIRAYINNHLTGEYATYEAENGEAGLKLAQSILPDLIISDIMMPVKDGLELSRELKSDIRTSHIPVILLTARASIHQIKEGLGSGADDYVTKPFDAGLLKAKVDSIIVNRKLLKETFIKSFSVELPDREITNRDELFLLRSYDFVRNNIDNSRISIEEFGRNMQLDRTQLFRRLKSLTGMSPSQFISTMRLKVAAELLVSTGLSVSEIAYKVGFDTPSYFATSFKRIYGVSPSEYVSSKRSPRE